MKLSTKLVLTEKQIDDLDYALAIVRMNQNTHDDKEMDAQSVRAYKLLDKLFTEFGIKQ